MYLAHRIGGWPMQRVLWRYVETGVLRFYALTDQDAGRMQDLMQQFRNIPMDLADASLVVAAEFLNLSQIFTLDAHFHAYRIHGTGAFLLIP
jgi:predicted nucleic acid-binding protein